MLTMLGNPEHARPEAVAIIGARNASAAGRKIARDVAAELGRIGLAVIAGLGIDGEGHAASLASGTVAVLGGSIDHVYPPQHERLHREIAERGLIISESPAGYTARGQDFPRRNRIVTGLARGTVVVEAAERSGSLISARMAGEQGREVMAVPSSPLDPRAAGTNRLIRQGAALVRHAEDVLEVLSGLPPLQVAAPPAPEFEADFPGGEVPRDMLARVRDALTPHAMPLDEIARASGLSAAQCSAVLMELELAGDAIPLSGGLAVRAV